MWWNNLKYKNLDLKNGQRLFSSSLDGIYFEAANDQIQLLKEDIQQKLKLVGHVFDSDEAFTEFTKERITRVQNHQESCHDFLLDFFLDTKKGLLVSRVDKNMNLIEIEEESILAFKQY